jgi:hypothetical protein
MTSPTPNPKAVSHGVELQLDTVIAGLQSKVPAGVTSLPVRNTQVSISDCLAKAQALVKPWKDVRAARATIRGVMTNRPADTTAARGFLTDMKTALAAVLGVDSQELVDFGFHPKKPRRALTSGQQVVSTAKAAQTRAQRHTMGSKQKASLRTTGNSAVMVGPDGTLIAPPASQPPTTNPSSK